MDRPSHDLLTHPPLTSLYRGAERLAIESALDDVRLEHRPHVGRALLQRLHLRRS